MQPWKKVRSCLTDVLVGEKGGEVLITSFEVTRRVAENASAQQIHLQTTPRVPRFYSSSVKSLGKRLHKQGLSCKT